jgi:predicted transposase YdaD
MQTNDILWKKAIEDFFEEFVGFFFYKEAHLIDFSKGYEFLDQELAQLFPESVDSKRYVDKLVKVYLKDGEERWILIHIEVQGYEDKKFPERMFCYYYRLKDRFGIEITALAIFTDKNPKYKPKKYCKKLFGTIIKYEFIIYKVLSQKESELIKSQNPFAIIVLATLKALKKGKMDDNGIAQIKRNLVKMLYERNYTKTQIQKLFYFINYYIRFAEPKNAIIFAEEIISTYQPQSESMGIIEACIELQKEHEIEYATNKGIDLGKEIGIDLGKEIGIDLGKENKTIEIVLTAHSKGVSIEFIAEIVQLPISRVKEIIDKHLQN